MKAALIPLLGLLCFTSVLAAQPDSTSHVDKLIEGVTVQGKSKERQLRSLGLPISVISLRQIQGTASSVEDILTRTAGITLRQTGGVGSSSRLSVRGLEGKRIGIYIDEQPIGELSEAISLNDIPLDMIERIEVYKGIVPNKMGGNSMGGAVNIVLKEYPAKYLDASYEIGSFRTHRLNSVLKFHNKATGLTFGIGGGLISSANNYWMTLPQRQGIRVQRDHDQFRKILAGGSITADNKWGLDRWKLETFFANTYRELQGLETPIDSAYNHGISIGANLLARKQDFLFPGLDFDNELSFVFSRSGLHDRAMGRRDWDGTRYPPTSSHGGELQHIPSDGYGHTYIFADKLYLNYTFSSTQALSLFARVSSTVDRPRDEYQLHTMGFEANRPGSVFTTTLGLGHEAYALQRKLLSSLTAKWYYYKSRGEIAPYFGANVFDPIEVHNSDFGINEALRYQLSKTLSLKGSLAWDMRLPTTEELLGNGYLIIPSSSLQPERALSTNLGMLYQQSYEYGRTEIEINAFANHLKHMSRLVPAMGPAVQYMSFGAMRTFGIEGEIKSDLTPYLYAYANATYQDLRDVRLLEPGSQRPNATYRKRMPNIPYLLGNAGFELHQTNLFGLRGTNTRLLCDASYIHWYFYDFEVSRFQERRIPTSFTIDAGLEYSLDGGRWVITAKAKNLLDRTHYSEYYQPLPGRSFSLKIRYLLK